LWSHGQWSRGPADHLGEYPFGSDTVAYYQKEIEAPWFAFQLKDQGQSDLPEATMFQTGSNQWKTYDTWPPLEKTTDHNLYLHPGGELVSTEPQQTTTSPATRSYASWISDPHKPVPYTKRPITGFWSGLRGSTEPRFGRAGVLWKVEDQRFAEGRPDVLVFETEPLAQDLEVTGRIQVHLFASTSGTDADWAVKLIDV